MKPQNKLQHRILDMAQHLSVITPHQKEWALEHCLLHVAYRQKTKTQCLDCGHVWPTKRDESKQCDCPGCGHALAIEDCTKLKLNQREFFGVVDTCDGYQLNRFWEIRANHKAGEAAKISVVEIIQHWMNENAKVQIVARQHNTSFYCDSWSGYLEIRNPRSIYKYDIGPTKYYPVMDMLPIYSRNGFSAAAEGISCYKLLVGIIGDSKAETLLKAGQYHLCGHRVGNGQSSMGITRHWDSIKICIRNDYYISQVKDWLDYIDVLKHFGKDLRSAHYVCPDNLHEAHQHYVALKRAEDERIRAERDERQRAIDEVANKRKKFLSTNKGYKSIRAPFFGLLFKTGKLEIKVLETIQEFKKEGILLDHCVYTNAYYTFEKSLIMSARLEGQPVETIEIDLENMKVDQVRGLHNEPTEHHDKIVKCVQKNLTKIHKIYKQLKVA